MYTVGMKTGIFPGTFDPITRGHSDLVERACQLFETVIIAVAENPGKNPLLSFEQRIELVSATTAHLPQVRVQGFTGLLIDFARKEQAQVIIRSLRTSADFDHELQLAHMNAQLAPEIQTLFLTPNPQYDFISSSLVREITRLKGDVSPFVQPIVTKTLKKLWP
jgi:pantetheine-phosphate adenylyltransferase